MLERHVHLPIGPDELWEELTDPDALADWLGADVEWELRPDGPAQFSEADGASRHGRVTEVDPGRLLRFTWWSPDAPDSASEVTWTLVPGSDGTTLTVIESPAPPVAATALAAGDRWTTDDDRQLRRWMGQARLLVTA